MCKCTCNTPKRVTVPIKVEYKGKTYKVSPVPRTTVPTYKINLSKKYSLLIREGAMFDVTLANSKGKTIVDLYYYATLNIKDILEDIKEFFQNEMDDLDNELEDFEDQKEELHSALQETDSSIAYNRKVFEKQATRMKELKALL